VVGDEASVEQIGRGKDIMSTLSYSIVDFRADDWVSEG
jgi:hypothetical protein